jgi:hypothetical protein
MSFALGKNIDSRVSRQINLLQDLAKRKAIGGFNAEQAAYYFNSKTPWIKLTSAIEFSETGSEDVQRFFNKTGNQLAKENILFNLDPKTTSLDLPASNEYTELYGIRPKPGITGMSIHTHNRFGSLRTATVSFICWDPNQLAILELLYMRPGYSVILEFGHSVNISSDLTYLQPPIVDDSPLPNTVTDAELKARGRIITNADESLQLDTVDVVDDIDRFDLNDTTSGINFFGDDSTISTAEDVYRAIADKRIENSFAYDGVYGIVKNFSWSLRADGGYDCVTSIVSKGELIESMKVDLSVPVVEFGGFTYDIALNLGLSNEQQRQNIVTGNSPQGVDESPETLSFTQELNNAGITIFHTANPTDRTFRVTSPVQSNTPDLAESSFGIFPPNYVTNGSATLITTTSIAEPGPNGTVYFGVGVYKFNL